MTIRDLPQGEEIRQIRESVRKLCESFPPEYWREVDRNRAYPTEFVQALSGAVYLSVLIPEE
jgi:alkylation response protein AidB-like acyl-CoA dehydrogenase